MIYLDNAATTRIDEEVLEAYIKAQRNFFANTTSLHKLGQEANFMFEKAKSEILQTLNLKSHDMIFVSNATEGNNLAIYGCCNGKSGKIITTKIEHPSVYEVYKSLEQKGYEVVYLNVDENGCVLLDELEHEIDNNTLLVSIMWVNNIVGSIQPIKEIIEIVKKYPKCKLHVDAVQGLCKDVQDFDLNDIDLFTFSTHKIYGPKACGGLLLKNSIELEKVLLGSKVQKGIKPGTIDLGLVCATTKAIKKFYGMRYKHLEYVKKLNKRLIDGIVDNKAIVINSPYQSKNYLPYILSISIPGINGETIVHALEAKQIYVSTGSSCSSKLKKPEKTIYAMTNDSLKATTAIRLSFTHSNTIEEIDEFVKCINNITNYSK